MPTKNRDFKTVYVIRDYKKSGIILDLIIEISPGKYKSIKFRHTFYGPGDFVTTMEEALEFCRQFSH